MPNTKSVHLKSYKKFVIQRGGQEALRRILDQMSSEDREVVDRSTLHTEWLDCRLWWRLLVAADHVLGKGDFRVIREIGAFDARENLNGVYRVFLPFLKPGFLVARAPLMWRQYYDSGRLQVAGADPRRTELRLEQFPGLAVNHEWELIGWMEEAFRMTGNTTVKVTHPGPCLAKGDPYCTFVVVWQ